MSAISFPAKNISRYDGSQRWSIVNGTIGPLQSTMVYRQRYDWNSAVNDGPSSTVRSESCTQRWSFVSHDGCDTSTSKRPAFHMYELIICLFPRPFGMYIPFEEKQNVLIERLLASNRNSQGTPSMPRAGKGHAGKQLQKKSRYPLSSEHRWSLLHRLSAAASSSLCYCLTVALLHQLFSSTPTLR